MKQNLKQKILIIPFRSQKIKQNIISTNIIWAQMALRIRLLFSLIQDLKALYSLMAFYVAFSRREYVWIYVFHIHPHQYYDSWSNFVYLSDNMAKIFTITIIGIACFQSTNIPVCSTSSNYRFDLHNWVAGHMISSMPAACSHGTVSDLKTACKR